MRYLKREHDADIRRWALVANPMAHSTTMFRRIVNDHATGYDETLGGFSDWNLSLQLGQAGRLYNFQALFACYTLWQGSSSFGHVRADVRCAMTIIKRHRGAYRGVAAAMALTSLHYAYSFLPLIVRRHAFSHLSRLKKRIFGRRAAFPLTPMAPAAQPRSTKANQPSEQKPDLTAAGS
jgi:hypothetical protein